MFESFLEFTQQEELIAGRENQRMEHKFQETREMSLSYHLEVGLHSYILFIE